MRSFKNFVIILFTSLCIFYSNIDAQAQCDGVDVIIKLDDLRANSNNTYNSSWQRLVDTVRSYNIKAALGPVMIDLTKGSQAFKDSLKSWHESDYFELWHHGWTHTRADYPPDRNNAGEFSGPPYKYQKKLFEDGMKIAQSELGITLRTFGAPYNQTDATFKRVIEESPDMKVWLYCNDPSYSEMCLRRGSSNLLESSTGIVSFDSFLSAYTNNTNPYLVLQGHPGQWNTASFEQFDMVIDFLKEKGSCFVLPYEYYKEQINNPLLYSESFSNPDSLYLYGSGSKVVASQTCCGELKLAMKSGATLGINEPLVHKIAVNGAINTVDIEQTSKVYIRLRSEVAMDLRLDLSDGEHATDGTTGKLTQSIPADIEGWTELIFDFPSSSLEESGLNTRQISEFHLYPNPTSDNFLGKLYIDYIRIGADIGELASCRSDLDVDVCAALFEDQFDDGNVTLSGNSLNALYIRESGCGELVLSMKEGETLPKNEPIYYDFPEKMNFTINPIVVVRLRSSKSNNLGLDLSDGTNSTNGSNGKITNSISAYTYAWTIQEYNFPESAFAESNVDATAISRIEMYLDPNNDNFEGTLYFDFISAGKPTDTGNAIGFSEMDSCGIEEVIPDPLANTSSEEWDVSIFPNPVNDHLEIVTNQKWHGASLKILSINGAEMSTESISMNTERIVLATDSFPSGVYLIIIEKGDARITRRIFKN